MFERLIATRARRTPNAVALRSVRESFTFAEFDGDIRRAAVWLSSRRLPAGSRVVVQVGDPYYHWVMMLALEMLGLVSVGDILQITMTQARFEFLDARLVISTLAKPDGVDAPWIQLNSGWRKTLRNFQPQRAPRRERHDDDPITILLTSGTTGTAKKIPIHRKLFDARFKHAATVMGLVPGTVMIPEIPMQSIGGWLVTFGAWISEVTPWYPGADLGWETVLAGSDPMIVMGAPIHLSRVIAALPADAVPRPNLRVWLGGGELSKPLATAIQQRLTGDVRMSYGSTEGGIVTQETVARLDGQPHVEGEVLPWVEVELRDPHGAVVGPGETGELFVRGEDVAPGYADDPAGNAASFGGGWYRTGDLARLDGTLLRIEGRVDELVNLGGLKLMPALLEGRLLEIAGMLDVGVCRIAQESGVDRLGIGYVADDDIPVEILTETLRQFPDRTIARIDHLPRNAMGKIDRDALAAMIETAPQ